MLAAMPPVSDDTGVNAGFLLRNFVIVIDSRLCVGSFYLPLGVKDCESTVTVEEVVSELAFADDYVTRYQNTYFTANPYYLVILYLS